VLRDCDTDRHPNHPYAWASHSRSGKTPSFLRDLSPVNVAVFRALQLGDMLCAVPALRALRATLGRSHVTLIGLPWARGFSQRFSHYLDDFIQFPGFPGLPEQRPDGAAFDGFVHLARARRFDLVVQMHGDGRITNGIAAGLGASVRAGFCRDGEESPGRLPYPRSGSEVRRLLHLAEFLGAAPAGEELEFPLGAEDLTELEAFAAGRDLPAHGYLCLHAGARAAERRWPPEHFAAAGDALHSEYRMPVVLSGSTEESVLVGSVKRAMRCPAGVAAGPLSVGGLAALLSRARLLVTNDTGVSHLAAALKVPSVVVFLKSELERWAPRDRRLHRPVWDPGASRLDEVLTQARQLLDAAQAPSATAARRVPPPR
jgi:hypothetical protein